MAETCARELQNVQWPANVQLKPYVSVKSAPPVNALPPFGPWPKTSSGELPQPKDFKHFSKRYNALPVEEKNALIMQARRDWYDALTAAGVVNAQEEVQTQSVEQEAKQ